MVDLPKKVSLHMILGDLVQKLIFQNGATQPSKIKGGSVL